MRGVFLGTIAWLAACGDPGPGRGLIRVGQYPDTIPVRSGFAYFHPRGIEPPVVPQCTPSTHGSWSVLECFNDGGALPSPDAIDIRGLVSAGDVTIDVAGQKMTLTRGLDGVYVGYGSEWWWSGGETATVQTTGGGAPPFRASLTAPTRLTVATPATDGGYAVVSRSAPLDIGWNEGEGEVELFLFSGIADGRNIRAKAKGQTSASVPASVMALCAGDGSLTVSRVTSTTVSGGGWSVDVIAGTRDAIVPLRIP
jgi:hypothetical protein